MTPPDGDHPRSRPAELVSRETQVREWLLAALFFICAFVAVLAVALIFAFVGWKAAPILTEVGLRAFLLGKVWAPSDGQYGIRTLIQGSFIVTLGALAIGTPLAVGTAVFLSEIASPRVRESCALRLSCWQASPRSSTGSSASSCCGR